MELLKISCSEMYNVHCITNPLLKRCKSFVNLRSGIHFRAVFEIFHFGSLFKLKQPNSVPEHWGILV